ncbi:hypothetical protein [Caballeronia sp. LZ035]|uniref:hypothetical protein n=1 Tax=Caballeronia sp. LZ035 TaxID=3038568 RepID=UPI00285BA215|nr:hypothetical protein [Caballeronia sp. LZ035]MDR5756988.1 hypothetical protein [Caballeronia sp. LZ035]
MFRKIIVVAALASLFVGHAQASGVEGGIVVGAGASAFGGSVSGSAASISNGNAVTAAQVGGSGASYQNAFNNTGGTATIGGGVNSVGAQVVTNTTQFSNSGVTGSAVGNAPTNVGDSIANGGAAYGSTTTAAQGNAQFATGAIGAVGAIGGIAGVSFIH